jgi:hypothetical protein
MLVSRSTRSESTPGNLESDRPAISADGRYVAFTSEATNLVAGDTNGTRDIFLRDTCAGVASGCTPSTIRVSVSTDGTQGNLTSGAPSISADGRFISFVSDSILVLGDLNDESDAFTRDTCIGATSCTPATIRISTVTDGNAESQGVAESTSMGATGRYVAFMAQLRCLGCNITRREIHVYDTCVAAPSGCAPTDTLAVLDSSSNGPIGMADRSLSSDGRFVTYFSDRNIEYGAWVQDTCIGAAPGCTSALRAIHTSPQQSAITATLSPDGRFISHGHHGLNPGDRAHIHIDDTCFGSPAGCTLKDVRVSESDAGVAADQSSFNSTLSADGSRAAFSSDATNLVAGDTNSRRDIFVSRTGLSP